MWVVQPPSQYLAGTSVKQGLSDNARHGRGVAGGWVKNERFSLFWKKMRNPKP